METARNQKVNLKLEGQPCQACRMPMGLGDDAMVCTACETGHHAKCWNSFGGCAKPGCTHAPARPVAPPVAALPPPPVMPAGMMPCPACRSAIYIGSPVCPYCRAITSPDGIYHGPKTNAPGAVASMVCGIIGILFCGIVLGPVAIGLGSSARRHISQNPTYGGGGFAIAGLVLGILALIVNVIGFIIVAGGSR
jgi:hypothetical protein